MRNLNLFNNLTKLHKVLSKISRQNTIVATNESSNVVNQIVTPHVEQMKLTTLVPLSRIKRNFVASLLRGYSTESDSTKKTPEAAEAFYSNLRVTETTLDEFRAREEAREQARDQQPDNEKEAKKQKAEAVRAIILNAALQHVPEMGWSRKAIIQGAEDAGYPSVVHGMFPEGGFALVSYFNGKCNDELVAFLQSETAGGTKKITNEGEFLVKAVRRRLEMVLPYKQQWPQALGLVSMPQNCGTSLAQLLTVVDDICYYAGDRSVDIGWYTRRVGLASIMKATELYMLQDSSPQQENTWKFLQNRMDEAFQLESALTPTGDIAGKMSRSFNTVFVTARNMLGLGHDR